MTVLKISILFIAGISFTACSQTQEAGAENQTNSDTIRIVESEAADSTDNQWKSLTPEETYVIVNKGTERPWTGQYVTHKEKGTYVCKRCNHPLFTSESKFESGTGWPSFDDMIDNNVKTLTDEDGMRTEIVCGNCEGHLGHVFMGEGFTDKNTRHCVNSISLGFAPEK